MNAGSMRGMTLRASELVATLAQLAGRGVTVSQDVQETPWARFISFDDPDGNSWIIQEPKV
jgi:uncharacterized glyoxalase superfamily protein PhnB